MEPVHVHAVEIDRDHQSTTEDELLRSLASQAVEVALTRGVILRGSNVQGKTAECHGGALNIDHARFTLWPSRFPKTHYANLLQTQTDFNLLLDKMSQNKSFLLDALQQ